MRVRLTQIDGNSRTPNLALMKLSHWHKSRGDEVVFTRNVPKDMLEGDYDMVYGAAIFARSMPLVYRFLQQWPGAIVGGTALGGEDEWNTIEAQLGIEEYEHYDYSIYPDFKASIGFTMRGCRLKCKFCVVPGKEGKPRSVNSIYDIWRGPGYPKQIVLLDNDFFGQPPHEYEARIQEIIDGGFKVSFNQGINVRLLRKQEHADALFRMRCQDDGFTRRCIYTAFDNAEDEAVFRRGVDFLVNAGFKGDHILVYMLVGFDPEETWEKIHHRLAVMREYNIRVYPMVYQQFGNADPENSLDRQELRAFQRWIIRRYDRFTTFDEYKKLKDARNLHDTAKELDLFGMEAA